MTPFTPDETLFNSALNPEETPIKLILADLADESTNAFSLAFALSSSSPKSKIGFFASLAFLPIPSRAFSALTDSVATSFKAVFVFLVPAAAESISCAAFFAFLPTPSSAFSVFPPCSASALRLFVTLTAESLSLTITPNSTISCAIVYRHLIDSMIAGSPNKIRRN